MRTNLPQPAPLTKDEARRLAEVDHRNVFCPMYNVCLDNVLRQDWDDWTCRGCTLAQLNMAPSAVKFAHAQRPDRD